MNTMEHCWTIKKNEILLFATVWMDLVGIMLGEISQTRKDIPYNFTDMWNLKNKRNKIEIDL